MKLPSVEVIVLNYKGADLTIKAVESLLITDYRNFTITLVDNGSKDGSVETFKKNFGKKVKLIANSNNLGFSGGNNVAMRKSKSKYVCLFNNDAVATRSWLKNLVDFMEEHEDVGACQSKVLSLRDPNKFEYAGAAGGMIDVFGYPICRGRVFDEIEMDRGQYDNSFECFWACGVSMMLRKSALDKVGYLDENFFMYGEELDLSWRMHLAGYKVYCVPSSIIYHLGRGTAGKKENRSNSEYLLHRNHFTILFKNYSSATLAKILPAKFILEAMTFGAFLFRKPDVSYASLRSMLWVLTNPRFLIRKHNENKKIRNVSDKEVMKNMINSSTPLLYFIGGKKRFNDYKKYAPYLQESKDEQ